MAIADPAGGRKALTASVSKSAMEETVLSIKAVMLSSVDLLPCESLGENRLGTASLVFLQLLLSLSLSLSLSLDH